MSLKDFVVSDKYGVRPLELLALLPLICGLPLHSQAFFLLRRFFTFCFWVPTARPLLKWEWGLSAYVPPHKKLETPSLRDLWRHPAVVRSETQDLCEVTESKLSRDVLNHTCPTPLPKSGSPARATFSVRPTLTTIKKRPHKIKIRLFASNSILLLQKAQKTP